MILSALLFFLSVPSLMRVAYSGSLILALLTEVLTGAAFFSFLGFLAGLVTMWMSRTESGPAFGPA